MKTYSYYDTIKEIVGEETTSVSYTEESLSIHLSNGNTVVFNAEGDCCSHSFIEDIDDPSVFDNATILEVSDESGEQLDIGDWEVHKWTFYKFKTTKGYATLSFRNESNGYYDGSLVFDRIIYK